MATAQSVLADAQRRRDELLAEISRAERYVESLLGTPPTDIWLRSAAQRNRRHPAPTRGHELSCDGDAALASRAKAAASKLAKRRPNA